MLQVLRGEQLAAIAPLLIAGSALALVPAGLGLVASFFHLGHPERAWRTATCWRTSWLSREVIVLPAFMAVVFLYGVAHLAGFLPVLATLPSGIAIDATVALGVAGTLLAFALFVCTGMIYACLRFLAEWHTPLTPINYMLLGGASGFTLAAALAALLDPERVEFLAGWAIVLTALGACGRVASLLRNARLTPRSTIQSAIGVKHPRVVQRSMGFMGGSFNTREFFHGAGDTWLRAVKPAFVVLAFVVPLVLLLLAYAQPRAAPLLAAAFGVQYVGLAAAPKNIVLSEAGPIDDILRAHFRHPDITEAQRRQCLQWLVGALAWRRHPAEKNVFIKFDCWHVMFLPLVQRTFPDVPWIFLYREPLE